MINQRNKPAWQSIVVSKQSKRSQAPRTPAQAGRVDALPAELGEVKVMANVAPSPAGKATAMIALPASSTVRDSAEIKAALLLLLNRDEVTIDTCAVERVDTAVLQLMLAFVRDRNDAGRTTQWVGQSDCVDEAVSILGLRERLQIPLNDAVPQRLT